MALIGRWSGGAVSVLPTTTWAAPSSAVASTEDRNDASYTWTGSSSTLTLPASVADGYLIRCSLEFEDDSNGRHNPQGRWQQTSGTGNFVTTQVSGYNRDNSEDRAYLQAVAFVDSPSASSEYQFQWRRDTDVPSGGTEQTHIEVVPLYYAAAGLYTGSTGTAVSTQAVTTQLNLGTTVLESGDIARSGNVVTISGDNKRYLVIGGYYGQSWATNRTQVIGALGVDGTEDRHTRSISYIRSSSNADGGCIFWDIVETATADKTLEILAGYGTKAVYDQGADAAPSLTPSNVHNALIVLELNDSADVVRGFDSTTTLGSASGQPIDGSTQVDIEAFNTVNFNDSASFTQESVTAINAEQAMDALAGANLSSARRTSSGARHTYVGTITRDAVALDHTRHGDYSRGDQGSIDTNGASVHPGGVVALTSGQNLGLSTLELSGTEAGTDNSMGVSFWAINLDTLEATATGATVALTGQSVSASQGTESVSGSSITSCPGQAVTAALGVLAVSGSLVVGLTGQSMTAAQGTPQGYEEKSIAVTLEGGGTTVSLTGQSISSQQGSVTTDGGVSVSLDGQVITVQSGTPAVGTSTQLTGQQFVAQQGAVSTASTSGVDLAGQSVAVSQGALTGYEEKSIAVTLEGGDRNVALSGQSLSSTQGLVVSLGSAQLGLTGQSLSALQGVLGVTGGLVTTLTGQSAVLSQGALAVSTDGATALTGQLLVVNQGTISVSGSALIILTGQGITAGQGGLATGLVYTLNGQPITADQGTPDTLTGSALSLAGQALDLAQGSVAISTDGAISLIGQSIAVEQGSLSALFDSVNGLTGQALTLEQGAISISAASGQSVSLNGQALTLEQGDLLLGQSLSLAGQEITAGQGSPTLKTGAVADLGGQQASLSQGTLSTGITVTLNGQTVTLEQGVFGLGVNVPLVGQVSTLAQGNLSLASDLVVGLEGQALALNQGVIDSEQVALGELEATLTAYVLLDGDIAGKATQTATVNTKSLLAGTHTSKALIEGTANTKPEITGNIESC